MKTYFLVTAAVLNFYNLVSPSEEEIIYNEQVRVWQGQNLILSCDTNETLSTYSRLWKKGTEFLTAATVVVSPDTRISVINGSTFQMDKISQEDAAKYQCIINRHPQLIMEYLVIVEEITCRSPERIDNGQVLPKQDTFAFGEQVEYSCRRGYTLSGDEERTCSLPGGLWSGSDPVCVLESVAAVNEKLTVLESKLEKLLKADVSSILKVEGKFSSLEERVKDLEDDTRTATGNRQRIDGVDRDIHYLKKALNQNAVRESWEKFLNTDVAKLGVRDGHVVSEYTWLVEDIEDKMQSYREENFKYIESPSFYTGVPGYHVILHLFPNYDQSDHIGLYAVLLEGRFDSVISWPFTSKYIMSFATLDEEMSDVYDTIVPAKIPSCKFEKPPPDNTIGCGFGKFVSHETLKSKGELHKIKGKLLVKISIYLDD